VVLADGGRGLVQEVFADMSDAGMHLLDVGFCLLPIVAELRFARHRPLIPGKTFLMFPEAVERLDVVAIAQSGKAGDTHIDADNVCRRMHWWFNLALGLDRHEPFAAVNRYGDVLDRAKNAPAVAVANPSQLG
jgi:hypothetical protein